MIQVVHPGSRIQGSKKHRIPDPGSATLFNRWPPTQTAVMLAPPPRPLRSSSCPADRPPQLLVGWPAHTCKSTPIRIRIFKLLKEPINRFQQINSASLCSLAARNDNPIPARFLAPEKFQHRFEDFVEQNRKKIVSIIYSNFPCFFFLVDRGQFYARFISVLILYL
jgi:hypothetical protein